MATTTAAVAAATTSAAMGGMGGMGDGSGCKISMLWNWYTIDSCFIASTWRITSPGMMAGSCIGVILLTLSLEFLRRAVKEYDRFLVRQHLNREATSTGTSPPTKAASGSGYQPKPWEQAIRAFLHMTQFAVAYFVMLLAMYYNGYIIICIFIGAYLGAFVFQRDTLGGGSEISATKEAAVCCK
ncbi:Ctr copper transporter family-domain-containing protein [Chaetomidium leptoderma]|uniref:Copper transport protein n=1 Tax=Chaetomidium leptoderma TaxID=669021 RepID=A0AAN6VHK9_9PEZI|nr:Ctr copper transporter family-domain-containing protein [Chaetomidium leptoderma]